MIQIDCVRKHLHAFEFRKLFIEELGWDRAQSIDTLIEVDEQEYVLEPIAQKRGLVVFHCPPSARRDFPDYATRRKIDARLRKSFHEHLIIFTDAEQSRQKWLWVRREPGKPSAGREAGLGPGQTGEILIQRLHYLAFSLEEEENLTVVDVASRVRASFDLERVTRRFYERFKTEHTAFLKFLQGVPDDEMQRWYVSVTLNRLMFVYFIQKKGFLDGDIDYLRTKLAQFPANADRYYREFLCPLFFEGFAQEERQPEIHRLLGKVPYLNGGIFQRHQIEEIHGHTIQIPDAAFKRLFDFFDSYNWHLDERPLRADNEINPDVLGFIFEKYINQKQMGAYYTKEDITGYIGKYTILPAIFDRARKECKVVFEGKSSVWQLLQEEPERYIYPAMLKGMNLELPEEIAVGLIDVTKRISWNRPADPDFALPTEIWRETVTRRQRAKEVRAKLHIGEVGDITDLITLNLDIQQIAQDVIENSEGPELVRAFWKALAEIKILDPTCGSGAFLFAALNILEPLYEACLDRMQAFMDDLEAAKARGEKQHPEKFSDFRKILDKVERHQGVAGAKRGYFIFKTIIVQNLYGVDIMEEAVEICKLRMFLKLIAQVDRVEEIEPLPDIDFNVRTGNTLVGFVTREEVRQALTSKGDQLTLSLGGESEAVRRVEERAELADKAFQRFLQMQTKNGMDASEFAGAKADLRQWLDALNEELNQALALRYLTAPVKPADYQHWLKTHQPFHWFVDFYGIIKNGGFDVIIGNPPYVEYSQVRNYYQVQGYQTETSGNLYAYCSERSIKLLDNKGWVGFVVQQPFVSTKRMKITRDLLLKNSSVIYSSTYDDRPSKLFDGMNHARIAILLSCKEKKSNSCKLYVTRYHKWYKEQRPNLFATVSYYLSKYHNELEIFPKIGTGVEEKILRAMLDLKQYLEALISPSETKYKVYYKITGVGHWFTVTCRSPRFIRNGEVSTSTRENSVSFPSKDWQTLFFSILNSTTFYWFFQVRTNCRDFNPSDYRTFPVPERLLKVDFGELAIKLQASLDISSNFIVNQNSKTGRIELEQFRPRESKSIIDQVDFKMAKYYGFGPEMIDFILNYDIKYRMGREVDENIDG